MFKNSIFIFDLKHKNTLFHFLQNSLEFDRIENFARRNEKIHFKKQDVFDFSKNPQNIII
jgi:hypothetical protein